MKLVYIADEKAYLMSKSHIKDTNNILYISDNVELCKMNSNIISFAYNDKLKAIEEVNKILSNINEMISSYKEKNFDLLKVMVYCEWGIGDKLLYCLNSVYMLNELVDVRHIDSLVIFGNWRVHDIVIALESLARYHHIRCSIYYTDSFKQVKCGLYYTGRLDWARLLHKYVSNMCIYQKVNKTKYDVLCFVPNDNQRSAEHVKNGPISVWSQCNVTTMVVFPTQIGCDRFDFEHKNVQKVALSDYKISTGSFIELVKVYYRIRRAYRGFDLKRQISSVWIADLCSELLKEYYADNLLNILVYDYTLETFFKHNSASVIVYPLINTVDSISIYRHSKKFDPIYMHMDTHWGGIVALNSRFTCREFLAPKLDVSIQVESQAHKLGIEIIKEKYDCECYELPGGMILKDGCESINGLIRSILVAPSVLNESNSVSGKNFVTQLKKIADIYPEVRMYFKFHPGDDAEYVSMVTDKANVLKIESDISIDEALNLVDLVITTPSHVIIDSLQREIPTLVLNDSMGLFEIDERLCEKGFVFRDTSKLIECIENILSDMEYRREFINKTHKLTNEILVASDYNINKEITLILCNKLNKLNNER